MGTEDAISNAFEVAPVVEGVVVMIQTTRLILFEFFVRFFDGRGRAFCPATSPGPGIGPPQEPRPPASQADPRSRSLGRWLPAGHWAAKAVGADDSPTKRMIAASSAAMSARTGPTLSPISLAIRPMFMVAT